MNIFLTSPDPRECAIALDDKRVNKMLLETTQLLCTTWHVLTGPYEHVHVFKGIYMPTHRNHPCAKWVRSSKSAYLWATEHAYELGREYHSRFYRHPDDPHKCLDIIDRAYGQFQSDKTLLPDGDLIFDFNCSDYDTGDVFYDYKLCMQAKWDTDSKPRWTNRGKPDWAKQVPIPPIGN